MQYLETIITFHSRKYIKMIRPVNYTCLMIGIPKTDVKYTSSNFTNDKP